MNAETERQQVLFLYLEHSGLFGRVVAWTFSDGLGKDVDVPGTTAGKPPYATGLDALKAGWRLIQVSAVPVRLPGAERVTGRLEHEAVFERIVPIES